MFEPGDYGKPTFWCVTTNGYVSLRKELVMGRGAAQQAALRYPKLPALFGAYISKTYPDARWSEDSRVHIYHFFPPLKVARQEAIPIAPFQVKYYFRDKADLDLIAASVDKLYYWMRDHPKVERIYLNFPGIGFGGLERFQVLPLLTKLDNRVTVWEKPGDLRPEVVQQPWLRMVQQHTNRNVQHRRRTTKEK